MSGSTFKRLPDSELLHVVVDTETLATSSSAGIVEIALVQVAGGIPRNWEIRPDSISYSMDKDPRTIHWHEERAPGYLERLNIRGMDWQQTMREVCKYLKELEAYAGKPICLWCQGTDFDIPILKANLECVLNHNEPLPWAYCYVRDIRTLAALYPEIKYEKGSHSALDDATKAAAHLRKIAFADPRVATMLGIPHG